MFRWSELSEFSGYTLLLWNNYFLHFFFDWNISGSRLDAAGSELKFEEDDLIENHIFVKYLRNNSSTKTAPCVTCFGISNDIFEKMYKSRLTAKETNIKIALSTSI